MCHGCLIREDIQGRGALARIRVREKERAVSAEPMDVPPVKRLQVSRDPWDEQSVRVFCSVESGVCALPKL